uniref:Uncharacterized protein n=1 Tax=Acrobeloides nanus TaxID=290746 RepID=A0A914DE34_9BILA
MSIKGCDAMQNIQPWLVVHDSQMKTNAVSHQLQNDTLKSRKEYRPVKYGSKPTKSKDSTIEESSTEHGIMNKTDDPIL